MFREVPGRLPEGVVLAKDPLASSCIESLGTNIYGHFKECRCENGLAYDEKLGLCRSPSHEPRLTEITGQFQNMSAEEPSNDTERSYRLTTSTNQSYKIFSEQNDHYDLYYQLFDQRKVTIRGYEFEKVNSISDRQLIFLLKEIKYAY